MKNKATGAYAGLVLAMVLWGGAFPSSQWATMHVPHAVAALMRFGGGAVVLAVIAAPQWRSHKPTRAMIGGACLAGLIGVFGYNTLFFWGVTMAPANDGSVIFPVLTPVFTTFVLIAMRKESARWLRILGLVLGVAGAALFFLTTGAQAATGSHRLEGDAVFALGAGVWTIYTLLNRQLLRGMDAVLAVAVQTAVGSVALALYAAPDLSKVAWSSQPGSFWLNAAYLSVGPTALSYLFFARGIRDLGASTAAIMMFAVPLFGTVFSLIFLHETFTFLQVVAAIVMVGGALLAVAAGNRPSTTVAREATGKSPEVAVGVPGPAGSRGPA